MFKLGFFPSPPPGGFKEQAEVVTSQKRGRISTRELLTSNSR
jgi:hypothetical protein